MIFISSFHEPRPALPKTPRPVRGLARKFAANAWPAGDVFGRDDVAPVFEPERRAGRVESLAGEFRAQSQRDGQRAGAGRKGRGEARHLAPFEHNFQTLNGFHAPDEYCVGHAFGRGDDIEQVVNAVAQINIGAAAFREHDLRARRAAVAEGVAGAVVGRAVGFGLGNAARRAEAVKLGDEHFAQQVTGDLHDIGAEKKFSRQQNDERCVVNVG